MINAKFYTKSGELTGFSISGHAEYSDGDDIVCASVSSAVQLTCNLITDSFKTEAEASAVGNTITLKLKSDDTNARKVLDGLKTHLTLIAEDYEGTIKITFTEV